MKKMSSVSFPDGSTYEIVDDTARNDISLEAANIKAEVAVERARINTLMDLPDGATTGDAELYDGRINNKGKIHPNIGTHIRTIDSKLDDYIHRTNLIEKGITVEIGSLTGSGVNSANTDFRTSDYIIAKPNTKYITNGVNQHIAFYDVNKNCLVCHNVKQAVLSPENTAFVRVDCYIPIVISIENVILCEGEYVDGDGVLSEKVLVKQVENEAIQLFTKTENLFDYTKPLYDGALNENGVIWQPTVSGWKTTDFIEIKPNTNYVTDCGGTICYYDELYQYISRDRWIPSVVTPENAKYVRFDSFGTYIDIEQVMFIEGDTLPTEYLPPYIPTFKIPQEKLQGLDITNWTNKNWVAYGDSITAISNGNGLNLGWAAYINSHYGFSNFYGRGVGGQSFIWNTSTFYANSDGTYAGRYGQGLTEPPAGTTEHKGCFCSWDRIKTMIPDDIKDTIDMVFIMGGTNDIGGPDVIKWETPNFNAENVTDTDWVNANEYNGGDYDITTFTGAICSAIMKMQVRCPNAVIVVGTPLAKWYSNKNAYNVNGVTMEDVADIMIKTARYMSTPYIDVNGNCGINGFNYSTYITDGTHPYCEAGHKMLARTINGGLNNILPLMK